MELDVQILGEVAREAPVFREDVANGRKHGHAAMPLGSVRPKNPNPKRTQQGNKKTRKPPHGRVLSKRRFTQFRAPQSPVGADQGAETS